MSNETTKEMALWEAEFGPEYKVPASIANHPELVDLSWHNDICPSFGLKAFPADGERHDLRLWVDHPKHTEREGGTTAAGAARPPRFFVSDCIEGGKEFFSTDERPTKAVIEGLVAALRTAAEIARNEDKAAKEKEVTKDGGLKSAAIKIHATCPSCGFDGNPLTEKALTEGANSSRGATDFYSNNHASGRGGFVTACESCGEWFAIERETVTDVQHIALILLGEDTLK